MTIDRSTCGATRHGTYWAYDSRGCRCPDAREDARLYRKRGRENRRPPRRINTLGSRRRIQALAWAGYDTQTIAQLCAVSTRTIDGINAAQHPTVLTSVADRITQVYDRHAYTPGPSPLAAARARNRGWTPAAAWDDIDNPDEQPWRPPTGRAARHADNIIDPIKLERVHTGQARFGDLTRLEQIELYRRHHRQLGPSEIARRWRISGDTLRRLADAIRQDEEVAA